MKIDLNYIPLNTAPKGVKNLAVYDENGKKVGIVPLGNLAPKSENNKLYTFGALSDVHLPYSTGPEDFIKALNYFNGIEKVDFICISGDMGQNGVDTEWMNYKAHVDTYSPNTPVHISAGNHDAGTDGKTYEFPIQYTGHPLYYSFEQGDDVFIMFGMTCWNAPPFSNESLQWLYETLEENRNKRCFVFQHAMRKGHAGDASGRYTWDALANTNGLVFLSLMEHYTNVLWFHGHSHCEFEQQDTLDLPNSNYDRLFGCHSIHIPSCCMTRNEDNGYDYEDSEGYVVDVYENGIHLRGRDFVAEKFLPIASYWIDTTLVEIPEKSYTDSRGVIDTGGSADTSPIIIPEETEVYLGQRYSQTVGGLTTDSTSTGMVALLIPMGDRPIGEYNLYINNIPLSITEHRNNTVYGTDSSATVFQYLVSNTGVFADMTSGLTTSNNGTNAQVHFESYEGMTHLALSLKLADGRAITEDDLNGIIIALEEVRMTLPEGATIKTDVRYTATQEEPQERGGFVGVKMPISTDGTKIYEISISNLPYPTIDYSNNAIHSWGTTTGTDYVNPESATAFINLNSATGCSFTSSTDKKSGVITCTPPATCEYILLSFLVTESNGQYIAIVGESILEGIVVTLKEVIEEGEGMTLPEGATYELDRRHSQAAGALTEAGGFIGITIPVTTDGTTEYELSISGLHYSTVAHTRNAIHAFDDTMSYRYINAEAATGGNTSFTALGALPSSTLEYSDDQKSMKMKFIPGDYCKYVLVSFLVTSTEGQYIATVGESILNGIVVTLEEVKEQEIDTPEGTEVLLNQRYSRSGGGLQAANGSVVFMIPFENNGNPHTLRIENSKLALNTAGHTLYLLDADKSNPQYVNGDGNLYLMTSGVTFSADGKAADVAFTPLPNTAYLVLTLMVIAESAGVISAEDIVNYVIELEEANELIVPEGTEVHLNKRYSQSGGGLSDAAGQVCFMIPADDTRETYTLMLKNLPDDLLDSTAATLYAVDKSTMTSLGYPGGVQHFMNMSSDVLSVNDDGTIEIICTSISGATHLALSCRIDLTGATITLADLNGIVITLKDHLVNVLPLAVNEDGTEFVGPNGEDGYATGNRIKSDGSMVTDAVSCASGFIPITNMNDVIRISGITLYGSGTQDRIALYDSSKVLVKQMEYTGNTLIEEGNVYKFRADHHLSSPIEMPVYLRFSCAKIDENTMVTINQVITEERFSTNVLPLAVNEDGTEFVGPNGEDGYTPGYRLNGSSGVIAVEGACMTGFIPVTQSATIRIRGIEQWDKSETNGNVDKIQWYDSSKSYLGQTTLMTTNGGMTMEDNGATYRFRPGYWVSGTAFIRFSTGVIDENTIVTVDEPIFTPPSDETGYTNLANPTSEDWMDNYRYSNSADAINGGKEDGGAGHVLTNLIPIKAGDVIRVKGLQVTTPTNGRAHYILGYGEPKDFTVMQFYGVASQEYPENSDGIKNHITVNDDGFEYTFGMMKEGKLIVGSDVAWLRIDASYLEGYTKDDVIITVNEPIFTPPSDESMVVPLGTTYSLNQNRDFDSLTLAEANGMVSFDIPVSANKKYKLTIKNNPVDLTSTSPSSLSSTIYETDKQIASAKSTTETYNIKGISERYISFSDNNCSAGITLVSELYMERIMLNLVVSTDGPITEADLNGLMIGLEELPVVITVPAGATHQENWRYSFSGGGSKENGGFFMARIPVSGDGTSEYTLSIENLPPSSTARPDNTNNTLYGMLSDDTLVDYILPSGNALIAASEYVTFNDDYTSMYVRVTPRADFAALALTLLITSNGEYYSPAQLDGLVISIEGGGNNSSGYTNQIPLSINADGTPFNEGQGWKAGYRMSLGSGTESAQAECECTGFIPVPDANAVIRMKNVGVYAIDGINSGYYGIVGYDENFQKLETNGAEINGMTANISEDGVVTLKPLNVHPHFANGGIVKYVRIGSTRIDDTSIITVNEPIE